MKGFLAKILIYTVIIAVIVGGVNYAYIKLDNSDEDGTMKYRNIPSSISICNFGSSHGLDSFYYGDISGKNCFNFALSGQSLSYDRRILDYYSEHIQKGAIVFFPVSYMSLFGADERDYEEFAQKNRRYYHILPKELIKEYDFKTEMYVEYFPALIAGVKLVRFLLGRTEGSPEDAQSQSAEEKGVDMKKNAALYYQLHFIEKKKDVNGNRIINEEEVGALKYMIKKCMDIGATPILVTTPFTREYTDEIEANDSRFFDDFYSLMDCIITETGVRYYDYSRDDRFRDNDDWFSDSNHLDRDGARHFVQVLMEDIA